MPDADPVLLEAALRGDIKAFAVLFERYRPDLYAICIRRLNGASPAEDAEDAVQDVFIRAFASLSNFDRRRPLWPWLVTIAFRACIDLQRRRSPEHYSGDVEVTADAGMRRVAPEGRTGSALDAVLASENRAELWQSLKLLPKRQRRVFLLYTLDGWSCAEIAEAEGISVHAVHHLLSRARRKMRNLREDGPLPAIVFPFTWLRWKFQQIEERIRISAGLYSDGFSSACVQAVCLGTVVAMVVAASDSPEPFDGNNAGRSVETAIPANILSSVQARTLQTVSPNITAPAKAPVDSQQSVAEPASALVDDVINPNESATPENTDFSSVVISPNYRSDHTIMAAGLCRGCIGKVLFISNDGGANWKPTSSHLFFGHTVSLPPGYPQDQRIFGIGDAGLQLSDDGGAIFRTVSGNVLGWALAISPLFGSESSTSILNGNSKVLFGGKTLLEYDATTGVTQPSALPIPQAEWAYTSITYSPNYQSDSTILVLDCHYDYQTLYRCKGSVCDERQIPIPGWLQMRLSPNFDQDGLAYVFTDRQLFVSRDGVRTFQEIPFLGSHIQDVAILWNASSGPVIFVSAHNYYSSVPQFPSGIYRSFDEGRSWGRTAIDLPGFGPYGYAKKLTVTPTGRLLASGVSSGIACSEDRGQTWARRCTPEL